ncbi:hypothetical protein D3C81_1552940 [compost metagenome]
MVSEGGYRSVLGFFTYAGATPAVAPTLREQLSLVRARYPDRLYVLVLQGPREVLRTYEDAGFTVFEDPTRAVTAIAAMGRFGRAFAAQAALPAPAVPPVVLPAETPSEAQAKQILRPTSCTSQRSAACCWTCATRTPCEKASPR